MLDLRQFLSDSARLRLAVAVTAAALCAWLFAAIAEDVWLERGFLPFDQSIRAWGEGAQGAIGPIVFGVLTFMGGIPCMTALILAVSGFLALRRRYADGTALLAGAILTALAIHYLKLLTARDRPPLQTIETTFSFPSGHSAMSLFVYGLIGYLLSRHRPRWRHAVAIMGSFLFLPALIGLSRLYLNVHWFSDVLGGFALGGFALCLAIAALERQGRKTP